MADFYDDDGEWDYLTELERYVLLSSQDAKLLWARTHDRTSEFIDKLISDPETDLATIARIFWSLQPSFYVTHSKDQWEGAEIGTILRNIDYNFYQKSDLTFDRYEIVHDVHAFINSVRTLDGPPQIRVPRKLMGPFKGRAAQIAPITDPAVQERLDAISDIAGFDLPVSHEDWWQEQKKGGNVWIAEHLTLSDEHEGFENSPDELDDLAYLERLYGTQKQYAEARKWGYAASQYLGKPRDKATRRLEIVYHLRDVLRTWKKAAPWLGLFFVVSMTIAIIARRLHFGVWL